VTIKDLLDLAQLVALVLAAAFFAVKLAQGWLIVNVSLAGTVERAPVSDTEDALAVSITVTKGSIGSLRVQEALVRVPAALGEQVKPLVGAQRLLLDPTSSHTVDRTWIDRGQRTYRLPPGESTTWSVDFRVPRGTVCAVEAVVTGLQPPGTVPAQWRCSLVSVPPPATAP
jgi:hypothetical protein